MKDFVEKYFYTRRKKTDRSLWKMEKRNGFHKLEILFSLPWTSFPLQEYFLKIEFRLISIMVSTSRKKALKPLSISQDKVSF